MYLVGGTSVLGFVLVVFWFKAFLWAGLDLV